MTKPIAADMYTDADSSHVGPVISPGRHIMSMMNCMAEDVNPHFEICFQATQMPCNNACLLLQTCTQMQTAVMLVQSYPLAVDVVSMMNCMAEDAGEPSLGDLLSGYTHTHMILDREALRVPSPDLLLEVAHWNIDYPKHSV